MAFIEYKQGVIDENTGAVVPSDQGTWEDLDSWATWTQYNFQPSTIVWTSELLDFGSIDFFTLEVLTDFQGTVNSYTIHVSETGSFTGEETETVIEEGDTAIPAFFGRYVYVTVDCDGARLNSMEINASRETFTIRLKNIDTSTLSGTSQSRTLTFTETPSQVIAMEIVATNNTAFDLDVYVTDYISSKLLLPVVTAKTATGPTFYLTGLDNVARDGIIDVTAVCLPGQKMENGQMIRIT